MIEVSVAHEYEVRLVDVSRGEPDWRKPGKAVQVGVEEQVEAVAADPKRRGPEPFERDWPKRWHPRSSVRQEATHLYRGGALSQAEPFPTLEYAELLVLSDATPGTQIGRQWPPSPTSEGQSRTHGAPITPSVLQ